MFKLDITLFFSVQFPTVYQYRSRSACEAEDVGASAAEEDEIQVNNLYIYI